MKIKEQKYKDYNYIVKHNDHTLQLIIPASIIIVDGEGLPLRASKFQLLRVILKNDNRATMTQILASIYPDKQLNLKDKKTYDVYYGRLRQIVYWLNKDIAPFYITRHADNDVGKPIFTLTAKNTKE